MGYIEKNLVDGETILYRAKISWATFIFPILLLIILIWMCSKFSPFLVVLSVLFSIYLILQILLIITTTEFALTNRRIIAKKGIIRQHSIDMMLGQVESIKVSQPIDGRIFNFGTVTVVGSGGTEEFFKSISNPLELRKQVNNQISKLSKP
ncbi:MAG: PH domain-containing protein [Anaerolineaceae bacterium]|jgi:uncharacterized membrane protein YdbT with pleckstrin-like domain